MNNEYEEKNFREFVLNMLGIEVIKPKFCKNHLYQSS